MTNNPVTFTPFCPHPDCEATLRVSPLLAAGDYPCRCKACIVRLRWARYLIAENKPYLELVEKEEMTDGT